MRCHFNENGVSFYGTHIDNCCCELHCNEVEEASGCLSAFPSLLTITDDRAMALPSWLDQNRTVDHNISTLPAIVKKIIQATEYSVPTGKVAPLYFNGYERLQPSVDMHPPLPPQQQKQQLCTLPPIGAQACKGGSSSLFCAIIKGMHEKGVPIISPMGTRLHAKRGSSAAYSEDCSQPLPLGEAQDVYSCVSPNSVINRDCTMTYHPESAGVMSTNVQPGTQEMVVLPRINTETTVTERQSCFTSDQHKEIIVKTNPYLPLLTCRHLVPKSKLRGAPLFKKHGNT